jgi:hypothetical protein
VERGVADILHRQCRVGDRLYSQRAVGNEAFDRLRSPDRMYRPPLAPGALLRAMTFFWLSTLIFLNGGAGKIYKPTA